MKIVHTADVHLDSEHPERMEALKEVLDICQEEEADILLITGDLFDKNINIEDLKTEIRPLFSDNSFDTFVIPGNHDKSAFRQEDYFGEDIEVLDERPFQKKVLDNLNLVAVPYTDKEFSEIVEDLSEAREEGMENLMMIHCTLSGVSGGFGEESRYMPVEPEEIIKTGYDHILAGHIHSSATKKSFEDTVFAYSGSPASVSSSETGRREIWVLDTEEGSMETRELDTFHYLKEEHDLLPGEIEKVSEKIKKNLENKETENAEIKVKVTGFTEKEVEEVKEELNKTLEEVSPLKSEIIVKGLESAKTLVKSDLYNDFKERMNEKEFENPELVEKKFLRGLSRYER